MLCQVWNNNDGVVLVFCGQWNHQFELLNYSEFGTTVDDVRYACDVSVISRSSSSTRRSSRQRPSSTNSGIDELRQLMTNRAPLTHDKQHDRADNVSAVRPAVSAAVRQVCWWTLENTLTMILFICAFIKWANLWLIMQFIVKNEWWKILIVQFWLRWCCWDTLSPSNDHVFLQRLLAF